MKKQEYIDFISSLNTAVDNGYEEELSRMTDEEILQDMIDETGCFTNISKKEAIKIISKWRNENVNQSKS